MKPGDTVYFLESGRNIKQVKIKRINGNLAVIQFAEGGGTQIPIKRLFESEEFLNRLVNGYVNKNNAQLL